MTTLVALATKDALVMGCDSLGTMTRHLIEPGDIISKFFDPEDGYNLKIGKDGKPKLKNFEDVYSLAQTVPFNHMTHVEKLFSLAPLEMGVTVTGISSIEERTIKSLINEFKSSDSAFSEKSKPSNYTVKSIGERLLAFIYKHYDDSFSKKGYRSTLELMIGGYDKQKELPSIYRIFVNKNEITQCFVGDFGIAFGGQMREIQRIVFGIDDENKINILHEFDLLFEVYRKRAAKYLSGRGVTETLPTLKQVEMEIPRFRLREFSANWGDFSEQNAIECVNFFVEIMIISQQFSDAMPTVGGDIHIALITKRGGFKFVSREEYEHKGFTTPKEGRGGGF